MTQLWQDIRFGIRTWRKNRAFAAVVVLTLGLGIGAATAIFSIVDTILLRPLAFSSSDRLVRVIENASTGGPSARIYQRGLSWQEFLDWRARTRTLSDSAAIGTSIAMVSTADGTARLWGSTTSANTFTMLGVRAMLGRTLLPGDDANPDVVLLSYNTWQRLFHSARDVVGTDIEFLSSASTGRRMTVIGVLPADFDLPIGVGDFYTPFRRDGGTAPFVSVTLLGRLADGVTSASAQQEATVIGAAVTKPPQVDPGQMPVPRFDVRSLKDLEIRPLQPAFRVLLAAVAVLMLVVCANVANLLLVRGTARHREISVRLALGAGRGRIVRQMMTECLVLGTAGGAIGALLGAAGIIAVKELASVEAPGIFKLSLGSSILPRLQEVHADPRAFAIALVISAGASLIFGVLPALYLSRPGSQSVMRATASRGATSSRGASRLRAVLVVGQLVMATVLLVSAGLLIHSFSKLASVDRGYASADVLAFQLVFPPEYSIARKVATIESILGRLRNTPGIASAGFTRHGVLIGEQITIGTFVPPGKSVEQMRGMPVLPSLRPVSGGYLTAIGARMLEGTDLNPLDGGSTPGIVISRSTARQFGPGRQVGKFVDWHVGDRIVQLQVVGVVNDLRNTSPDREPFPEVFIDYRQVLEVQRALGQAPLWQNERALGLLSFAVRTRGEAASASPAVARVVRDVDPNAGIDAILPLDRLVASSMARPRFYAVLLAVFAGVAGLLAAVGIYGVLSYAVVQRTQEIGVRMAIGAQRVHVLTLVLRQGSILTVLGTTLGLAAAAASTRLLQGMLFGITPLDPPTFVAVAVTFGLVALLACYVPARRATMVDPIVALRSE